MPHRGPGFLYYEFTYSCPWKNINNGSTGRENAFHTAVYTHVDKESHQGQTEWFKGSAIKAIEKEVNRWLASVDGNKKGIIYERFNRVNIQEDKFMYCETLRTHPNGPDKGRPYGVEIKNQT